MQKELYKIAMERQNIEAQFDEGGYNMPDAYTAVDDEGNAPPLAPPVPGPLFVPGLGDRLLVG